MRKQQDNYLFNNLWAKKYQVHPGRDSPPPLKFHKISVPGKYTTSNSLVDPKIRRDSYPDLLDIRKEEK